MYPARTKKQIVGTGRSGKTRLRDVKQEPAAQPSLFDAPNVALSDASGETAVRLVMRPTDALEPHQQRDTLLCQVGELPANIPLEARPVGWLRSGLESWLSQRIEQSGRRP